MGFHVVARNAPRGARAAAAVSETKSTVDDAACHDMDGGVLVPAVSAGTVGVPTSRHGLRCAALAFLQHLLAYDSMGWVAGDKMRLRMIVRSIAGAWVPPSSRKRGVEDILESCASDAAQPAAMAGGRRGLAAYGDRYLVPITTALVKCLSGDLQWKQVNLMVLEHSHDERPEVRELAIRCSQVVFDEAGTDDVMVLIPETLPFVAEALEDEDEAVEDSARSLFKRLEELSDEDLEDFIKGN